MLDIANQRRFDESKKADFPESEMQAIIDQTLGKVESVINKVTLRLPEGFPEESLISISFMEVQYDRSALMKKSVHITSLILHIDQVGIVKNKEGKLNVDSLKFIEKTKEFMDGLK